MGGRGMGAGWSGIDWRGDGDRVLSELYASGMVGTRYNVRGGNGCVD